MKGKWKKVNRFVYKSINNGRILLRVKVFQQHKFVLLEHTSHFNGKTIKIKRRVPFIQIDKMMGVVDFPNIICQSMKNDLDKTGRN